MKKLLTVAGMAIASLCFAQTAEIENELINRQFSEGKVSPAVAQEKAKAWRTMRDQYPKVPFDTVSNRVVVERVIAFPGISKAIAFKRCKEWAALNFRKLDSVVEYEDVESGKLILEGYVEVTHLVSFENIWGAQKSLPTKSDLHFSLVLTLVDGKAKVAYHNLRFSDYVPGYASGSSYVPGEWVDRSFESLFPIVNRDYSKWKGIMDLVVNSLSDINRTAPALERYITDYNRDYKF
jgi:hypothetical protein